jgi:hypothetical protein
MPDMLGVDRATTPPHLPQRERVERLGRREVLEPHLVHEVSALRRRGRGAGRVDAFDVQTAIACGVEEVPGSAADLDDPTDTHRRERVDARSRLGLHA